MIKLRKIAIILGLTLVVVLSLQSNNGVSAIDGSALTKKVLLRGLEKCYENAYIPSGTVIDGTKDSVSIDAIFSEQGKGDKEDTIRVFSKGIGNTLTQDVPAVSCKQVFAGWDGLKGGGSISGLNKITGKDFDISQVGFEVTESVAQRQACVRFPFSYVYKNVLYASDKNTSNGVCFMLDTDGNVMKDKNGNVINNNATMSGEHNGAIEVNLTFIDGIFSIDSNRPVVGMGVSSAIEINCASVFLSNPISFEKVVNCVGGGNGRDLNTSISVEVKLAPVITSDIDSPAANGLGSKWTKKPKGSALDALKYYGGIDSFNDITFTEAEKFAVLQEYVKKVMAEDGNLAVDPDSCYDSLSGLGDNYGILNAGKWCKLTGWENHKDEKFNVIKNVIKDDKQALMTVTFEDVLKRIKKIDESQIDSSSSLSIGVEDEEEKCRNSAGAKSLGWIVCPVLEWMGESADRVYTDYVSPSLQVKPELFTGGDNGDSVESAWSSFRDIANVLFIILLLVVIFSQLTGIGIDNYGIKKILPRLIVAAILINLSYLLCILAVDLSNILGNGLQSIFDSLSGGLGDATVNLSADKGGSFDVSGVLASVGVLAGIVGVVGAIWANPAILLSLLVGALGVVVSIFFLFILLAARKAAIIVLTAISPLAVVAYMLPNTKSLFDKWLKFFEGLLLVYPIAGLLVGAGDYVSRLLLSTSDGFFAALTAMVVGIVPIFFIPMVLKSSFAAMGKVGGMLTGLGDSAKRRATGAVRNTEAYRNAQKMGLERRTRTRAGVDRNGNLTTRGKIKAKGLDKLSKVPIVGGVARGAIKSQAALVSQARKDIGTSEAAVGVMAGALAESGISKAKKVELSDGGGELTQEGNYYAGRFLDAAKNKDITGMNAAIESMRNSNMKAKDISRVIRHAQNNQMFDGIDSDKRSAWYRDLSKKYGNDFLSTDFELSHFMRTGGSLNGGKLGNYGDYAKSAPINADEIKPEDLTKMSGDSLAAMIESGKITQGMAQRVMAMNPNISEDKKIMLGAVASGAATAGFDIEGNKLEGGTITSYKQFKDDVNKLMSNHAAETATIKTSPQDVEAWTGATPRDVRIVGGNTASSQSQFDVQPQRTSTPVSTPTSTIASSTGGSDGETLVGGSGASTVSGDYVEYDNISGRSSMMLREMPDGTLRDDSGNVYNPQRWKRRAVPAPQSQVQPVQSGRSLDTTTPFSDARANPQPSSVLRNAPQTPGGIVLPGSANGTGISSAADEVRRNPSNPPQP